MKLFGSSSDKIDATYIFLPLSLALFSALALALLALAVSLLALALLALSKGGSRIVVTPEVDHYLHELHQGLVWLPHLLHRVCIRPILLLLVGQVPFKVFPKVLENSNGSEYGLDDEKLNHILLMLPCLLELALQGIGLIS